MKNNISSTNSSCCLITSEASLWNDSCNSADDDNRHHVYTRSSINVSKLKSESSDCISEESSVLIDDAIEIIEKHMRNEKQHGLKFGTEEQLSTWASNASVDSSYQLVGDHKTNSDVNSCQEPDPSYASCVKNEPCDPNDPISNFDVQNFSDLIRFNRPSIIQEMPQSDLYDFKLLDSNTSTQWTDHSNMRSTPSHSSDSIQYRPSVISDVLTPVSSIAASSHILATSVQCDGSSVLTPTTWKPPGVEKDFDAQYFDPAWDPWDYQASQLDPYDYRYSYVIKFVP
ncbi:uncharacterized protein LOC125178571 [Hyalella azteca]|uniref:Uncharacterized protein LOC125178571 n=1 Tax=Hyalella azteca TaxID=294128 RepID=A0A979FQB0_HYAAZ|nr:uncharacterized protein LOC125178571 [Hyalella azteca]